LENLLQDYDSVAVRSGIELGGFDQLFNLEIGREIQKLFKQKPQDIIATKMLFGLDGRKMSTSWGNVINITDDPKEMYGKIMSVQDELMIDYFELCTKVPQKDLEIIKINLEKENINPRDLKKRLAREITATFYDMDKALRADGLILEDWQKIIEIRKGMVIQAGKRNFRKIK